MPATILDAKPIASRLRRQVADDLVLLRKEARVEPGLGILLVTGDQVTMAFTDKLSREADALGLPVVYTRVAERNIDAQFILRLQELAANPAVRGIYVATPHLDRPDFDTVVANLPGKMDLGGLHYANVGHLAVGKAHILPPKTRAVLELILEYIEDYQQRSYVIVTGRNDGYRGFLGRGLALHCADLNLPVTLRAPLAHRGAAPKDGELYNPKGEVLVALSNTIGALNKQNVARGSIVIDGGYNFHLQRVSGDANFTELSQSASMISPVPGGVDALAPLCALKNLTDLIRRDLRWESAEGEAKGLKARRRL